jgi:hypothetical protein
MAQRNLRMPDSLNQRLSGAARIEGYRSSSAFIRAAIVEKLSAGDAAADGMEERIAVTLSALATRLSRLETAIQAQFAFTDALARALLLCVPEPPDSIREEALARARLRHENLIRTAAISMHGDGRAAMAELVRREE